MRPLLIENLPRSDALDRAALRAVRGGIAIIERPMPTEPDPGFCGTGSPIFPAWPSLPSLPGVSWPSLPTWPTLPGPAGPAGPCGPALDPRAQ